MPATVLEREEEQFRIIYDTFGQQEWLLTSHLRNKGADKPPPPIEESRKSPTPNPFALVTSIWL